MSLFDRRVRQQKYTDWVDENEYVLKSSFRELCYYFNIDYNVYTNIVYNSTKTSAPIPKYIINRGKRANTKRTTRQLKNLEKGNNTDNEYSGINLQIKNALGLNDMWVLKGKIIKERRKEKYELEKEENKLVRIEKLEKEQEKKDKVFETFIEEYKCFPLIHNARYYIYHFLI